ncbi:MAG: ribonuclease III, partial [Chloroflexota bacterium]
MTDIVKKPAVDSPSEFAAGIGLKFSNPSLLSRSLTHSSFLNEHPEALEDNERLEFLGDAVLDFVVGAWLYHRYPEKNEGDLTRIRAALVRTEKLAEFGREINLGPAINLGNGEEENGGRTRDALLCGTFEALIGALYLDSKITAVEEFISPFLQAATDVILSNRKDRDAKGLLQEWVQAQGYDAPEYVVISESGPDHDKS